MKENVYGTSEEMDDEEVEKDSAATDNSSHSSNNQSDANSSNGHQGQENDIGKTRSHHSYEEIPPSEANSEVRIYFKLCSWALI